jgi:hypothetical protein
MPFDKQFAFIFSSNISDDKLLARTISHEIAHGTFDLRHTFSTKNTYTLPEGQTDNLMDYPTITNPATATSLNKYQWDLIHYPNKDWFSWLESEEEGTLMSPSLVGEGIFFYPIAEIRGITGMSNCSKVGNALEIGKYIVNPHYWRSSSGDEKLVFYLAVKEDKNYQFDWVILPKSLDKFKNEESVDRKLINDTYSDLADKAYNLMDQYLELADDFLRLWNANTTSEQFNATLRLSIQNIKRCWTDPLILVGCATGTIVAYEAYLAKVSVGTISSSVAKNGIKTPYGVAKQTYSQNALEAIDKVKGGAKLYRVGKLNQSQAAEG